MPSDYQPAFPVRVGNWWLLDKLGSGFSGSIFRARHVHKDEIAAVKLQLVDESCPTNRYEKGFYPFLQGGKGMPTLWEAGQEGPWDYLVMDLLGPSLDSLYRKSGKQTMDLRTVCCIAMQVIQRLETMHTRGILHRDIQLGNCVTGLGDNAHTIYMIDFGFSKKYIDECRRHIPDSRKKRDFIGNYWFSSVRVHCRGRVPSRRDDLEAAALMFIHLLTPRGLPWTRNGVPRTDTEHERLKAMKRNATPEELCKNIPVEFEEFLHYSRQLQFAEQPDYGRWREEFRQLALDNGFPDTDDFIWPPPEPSPPPEASTSSIPVPVQQQPVDVHGLLVELAQLRIDDRLVLGEKKIAPNVQEAVDRAKDEIKKPSKDSSENIITSGDSSDNDKVLDRPQDPIRLPKAAQLRKIAVDITKTVDNHAMSKIVIDYVRVLKAANSSRTLTKDGFAVLDALYKQLADPSVYVLPHTPMRTSRTRQGSQNDENSGQSNGRTAEVLLHRQKMNKLAELRRSVARAQTNRELAQLIQEFGALTNRASGRTVTKDGFTFLEGIAERLKTLDS
ncbi:CK1/CK1 protein kinase [Punctularia strigosozonata HHB-11173 SS5]|uniref:CK1/CK1 protein kinase n=1 Tax=Punctularia strigosozonata (strain HHB-11173) TaxID=741275 RepID=UPI0004416CA2|nr:CK1/CK1 protein kinase [Punctularia strigosozonata HHB-11173 SS5]EIN12763.1 CK1/CK1 protein kinase [Punctularia strigosozonata HHB-11173 SS5]